MPDFVSSHDSSRKWTPLPEWRKARIGGAGWTAAPVSGLHRLLVSGDLKAAQRALAPKAVNCGLWDNGGDGDLMIRIATDRALIVISHLPKFEAGWNGKGFAVSLASDGWMAFEIGGDQIGDLIAQSSSARIAAGSPSAAISFAGIPVLLVRRDKQTALIHVEEGQAAYFWRWLERAVED
ncbi:MAG: hypothetical protein WBO55_07260 [Rhizobiaceae bacterium]